MALEVDEEPLPSGWEVAMSRSKNMPYYHNSRTQKVYWGDNDLPRGWAHQFDQDGRKFYFHIKDKQGTLTYDKPVLRQRAASPPAYVPEDASPRPERRSSNSLRDILSNDPLEPPAHNTAPASSMSISNLVSFSSSANKRSFDQITKDEDPDAAADFYNKLKRNATADRAESLLFHMRSMNNWVKSIMINEYSKRDDHVLDLACGKGGDLMKWAKRGILKYVGADIAQKSLEDAVERFLSNVQHRDLEVQFVQGDLGRVSLLNDPLHCWTRERGWHDAVPVQEPCSFQIVSMQFSFHYMFGEEQRAARFFRTLHEVLCDGGIFIATTVDPNKVLHKYYQALGAKSSTQEEAQDGEEDQRPPPDVRIVDEKDREVCAIRFDASIRDRLAGYDASREGAFGLRYNFTLRDTDEASGGEKAVDLPEYLVPDDLLARLLKEHGFELLLQQNFHPFILKNLEKNRSLLDKMHVLNFEGTLSDAEWEIAGLYQVLAFKKAY
ncbi:hypothetical protein Poli38472_013449 [Pythium oligandrum]|uniref:mRNA (guanine-N(7))-methyltransferase n=1 Tax=Pythium oligandrum TaxID=41045 RepID=A0A8K1FC64_PYTOL|nr:hypothetical protein Poli38472_013449 [Pythium oligandrum]|eukprot:TMW57975.1 hypothetical protein Poli38472_013449 [Pythium oligandrum]